MSSDRTEPQPPSLPGYYWVKIVWPEPEPRWELVRVRQHPMWVSPMFVVDFFGGGCSTLELMNSIAAEWQIVDHQPSISPPVKEQ